MAIYSFRTEHAEDLSKILESCRLKKIQASMDVKCNSELKYFFVELEAHMDLAELVSFIRQLPDYENTLDTLRNCQLKNNEAALNRRS